ncbi:hypothetical protein Golob_024920, partial [Gossypium lobatum]|nr:hypothetical protein [Gossypium lobatum]
MGKTFLNLALLIIFHFFIMATSSMKLTTIVTDQLALLALKEHVIHDPENVLTTNWSASTPVCNWFGVSCGSKHRRVVALNITGLGLVGTLPPHLGNLSFLSLLSISDNSFDGELPVQLSNLRRLKHINFRNNNLSGEIPSWLGSLPELQRLFLYHNHFKGVIPFSLGNLSKLEMLDLFQNQLSGEIPQQIGNLTLLMVLDTADNNLTGIMPHQIGNLKHLELLNLGFNNIVGSIPPAIFNSTLSTISLELNHLSGHLPSDMGLWLPNLEYLYLGVNQLHGSFSKSICNASQLIQLDVSQNYFSGSIPDNLGNLRNLKVLDLQDNNLTSLGLSFLSSLTNCRGLEYLIFGENQLVSGQLPGLVGNLSRSLRRFDDSFCNISGSIPSEIGNLSSLISIFLFDSKLTGTIPTTVGGLKELQSLSLENNKLEGSIPFELCHLNKLAFLFLTNNKLSGPIPACLGNLISLRKLFLGSNMFSSSIPSSWTGLNDLLILNLSYNSLSGPLPIDMGKLQGEIPKGGPFGNYSIESFKGNEALCGAAQLHVPCSKTRPLRNSKVRTKLIISVALPIASAILVLALIIIILRRRKRKDRSTTQEDSTPLGTWRRISYHELHQATDGFSDRRLLGNGSYGSVYQGTLLDGMEFAVKVFKLELEGAFKSFDVECEVLRNIRHRNLIKIISSCSNDLDFKALVLEFMSNGSLDKWLYSNNHSLDILQRLNIMIDVASALEYLHHGNATPVVHCDLKPSNVLLDEDMVAHLSDFGIAKLL